MSGNQPDTTHQSDTEAGADSRPDTLTTPGPTTADVGQGSPPAASAGGGGGNSPQAVFTGVLGAVAGAYLITGSIPATVIAGSFALLITLLIFGRRR